MRAVRSLLLAGAAATLAIAAVSSAPAGASSTHTAQPKKITWAPASSASVHPGMQTITGANQCTANFVFTSGNDVYLGQAAHCSGTEGSTAVDGCLSASLPLGTPVEDGSGNRIGELAYSSWLTMHQVDEQDPSACAYNDFALVKLDPTAISNTNPSVPTFGGPTGVRDIQFAKFNQVWSYGNSNLRLGVALLPRRGVILNEVDAGWSHKAYTVTPGIPGDSGSGLLDTKGRASGVLSTIELRPYAGSNNFSDLLHVMDYAAAHGMKVSLVPGDVPFNHGLLGTLL